MPDRSGVRSASALDVAIAHQTHSVAGRLLSQQAFWIFLAAVIACVSLSLATETFATSQNLFNVTRNFAFVGIVALGMTVVIISGGIDLSVGSVLCLSAMVMAISMNAGVSFVLSAALAIGVSLLVGAVNGALIAYLRIPAFVVTLGMLSIARSAAMVLSDNKMVFQFGPDEDILFWVGGGSTFGIANPVIALVLFGLVTGGLLNWTRWGTHIFAVGANEKAAILTGISVRRTKVSVYMFSALMAGLAGILEAGWLGGVTTNLGQSMELTVIAATVIGGANLLGGAGTVFGSIVGAALIEVIRNCLILLGISTFWQGGFVGGFIILAVAFDRLRAYRDSEI
ncbi:ABC transporter permease [Microbaculum marinum]|uniref:ABC transporter permease n=1 Tax=Microbaculum marinum TaxID=1764581 RepID=A0AAW9RNT6_9HYPH